MMRNEPSIFFRPGAFRTMLLAFAGAALLCAGAPALAKTKPKPDAERTRRTPRRTPANPSSSGAMEIGRLCGVRQGQDLLRARFAQGAPAKSQDEGHPGLHLSLHPPGEGVRNEVAINLGYATKDGGAATADVDDDKFELVTKGVNASVKNPAKEKEFVEALRTGHQTLRQGRLRQGHDDGRQLFAQGPIGRAGPRRAGV